MTSIRSASSRGIRSKLTSSTVGSLIRTPSRNTLSPWGRPVTDEAEKPRSVRFGWNGLPCSFCTAGSVLLKKHTRTVTTCLGGWILLLILVIYVPMMIVALSDPGTPVKLEGVNYFADTLLFAGGILALAGAHDGASAPRGGG